MSNEDITELFRKSINILFVSNPRGTSIGVLLGVVLDGVLGVFSPLLKSVEALSFSAIKMWHLIGFGVISMNAPGYLRRNEVDPSILKAIKYIEDQKKNGRITDWQAKQMYVNLHQKVLENVTLNKETSDESARINRLYSESNQDKEANK
jgi:hypothetical protein